MYSLTYIEYSFDTIEENNWHIQEKRPISETVRIIFKRIYIIREQSIIIISEAIWKENCKEIPNKN